MSDKDCAGCVLVCLVIGMVFLPSCACMELAAGSPRLALVMAWIGGVNFGTFVTLLRAPGRREDSE